MSHLVRKTLLGKLIKRRDGRNDKRLFLTLVNMPLGVIKEEKNVSFNWKDGEYYNEKIFAWVNIRMRCYLMMAIIIICDSLIRGDSMITNSNSHSRIFRKEEEQRDVECLKT